MKISGLSDQINGDAIYPEGGVGGKSWWDVPSSATWPKALPQVRGSGERQWLELAMRGGG